MEFELQRCGKFYPLLRLVVLLFATLACVPRAIAEECVVKPEWKIEGVRLPRAISRVITDYVELGDIIAVKTSSLADLRKCASADTPTALYLNGMPLQGMAEFPPSNPIDSEVWFTLQINAKSRQVWTTLLGKPSIGETRPVFVSLGLSGGYPIRSQQMIALRPLPPLWFGLWTALFLLGIVVFFYFAAKSNLLRGGTPAGGRVFSIGRSRQRGGSSSSWLRTCLSDSRPEITPRA